MRLRRILISMRGLLFTLVLLAPVAWQLSPPSSLARTASEAKAPALPNGLYPVLARAETADDASAYALHDGVGANPTQGFGVRFTANGAQVRLGSGTAIDLTLAAYGYGAALQAVSAVAPVIDGNRAEYRHGGLTEWYVNTALGVEQGFTLAARPANLTPQPPLHSVGGVMQVC